MTVAKAKKELSRFLGRKPLEPFFVVLKDGKRLEVTRRLQLGFGYSQFGYVESMQGPVFQRPLRDIVSVEDGDSELEGSSEGRAVTIEQLRATQKAQPFLPFTLHLADGRSYRIDHPDFISSHPQGRTIIVYKAGMNGDLEILDLLLVVCIEVHKSDESRRKRKGA